MSGELKVGANFAGLNTTALSITSVIIPDVVGESAGFAQMSIPFGEITGESIPTYRGLDGRQPGVGLNCDSSGPIAVHKENCACLEWNRERDESEGTLTVLQPATHKTFYLAGPQTEQLKGKSIVVKCGSSFGSFANEPLVCAELQ